VLEDALEAYGEESGLLVNEQKTKALALGSWSTSTPIKFSYVEQVKVLGVLFTKTVTGMPAVNWPSRLYALRTALADARLRALNVIQRVHYANTYALAALWHCAMVVPMPVGVAKDARKALSKFIWAGEPLRVPMDVLVQPPQRGGLGLHDPELKAKAMFVARWTSASRAEESTLSGGWLAILNELYGDAATVPPAARHFSVIQSTAKELDIPDDIVGKVLNRAILRAMLANRMVAPRVQLHRPTAAWDTIWTRISLKALPLRARAAWYCAVHDVLPTNARLKATNQTDCAACPVCGADDTVLHRLTACQAESKAIWEWTARNLASLLNCTATSIVPDVIVVPDFAAPSKAASEAASWLLGTVVLYLVECSTHDLAKLKASILQQRQLVTCPKLRNIINSFS